MDTIQDLKPPILLTHLGVRPLNDRGMGTPTPSASPEQMVAVLWHAAWLIITTPILWLLPIVNLYRVGTFLTLLLGYWNFVHPQRDGAEQVALQEMLTVVCRNAADREQISAATRFLAAYRTQVEGGDVLLRCCRRFGLELLLPPVYTWVLGLVGSSMGPTMLLLISQIRLCSLDYRFGRTAAGRMIHVPWNAQPGDRIVLLRGGMIPFVVRKSGNRWQLQTWA